MPHLGEMPEEAETKECANDSAAGNEGVRNDSANDNTIQYRIFPESRQIQDYCRRSVYFPEINVLKKMRNEAQQSKNKWVNYCISGSS